MAKHGFLAVLLAIFGALALVPGTASAQATRTWVSGVGDDVNPCSRTAPCKTFAGAISKTAAGGEISCMDPGGYGAVTITKSIAIVCDGVAASVLASGTNGILILAKEGDRVLLSGLEINGAGTGIDGIRVSSAKSVIIRNVVIHGFATPASRGVAVQGAASVTVAGSTIVHNTIGLSGAVVSGGDNLLAGNDTDGQFASAKPRK